MHLIQKCAVNISSPDKILYLLHYELYLLSQYPAIDLDFIQFWSGAQISDFRKYNFFGGNRFHVTIKTMMVSGTTILEFHL